MRTHALRHSATRAIRDRNVAATAIRVAAELICAGSCALRHLNPGCCFIREHLDTGPATADTKPPWGLTGSRRQSAVRALEGMDNKPPE